MYFLLLEKLILDTVMNSQVITVVNFKKYLQKNIPKLKNYTFLKSFNKGDTNYILCCTDFVTIGMVLFLFLYI